MSTYFVLVGDRDNGRVDVVGPFPDTRAMDEWLTEHQEAVDDWLEWQREILGDAQFVRVDDDVATGPSIWLRKQEEVLNV